MEFVVTIEETVAQDFKIEADSFEEAMKKAEEKYKSGEIVVDSGEVHHKQMAASYNGEFMTEWTEF